MSNKIIKDAKLNTASSSKKNKPEPKRMEQSSSGAGVSLSARAVLLTLGAIVVILSCVYVAYDQFKEKIVMTIEGSDGKAVEYTMKDYGYYIYEGETEQSMYAQYYESMGYDYWNTENDDGSTAASQLADKIIEDTTQDFVLYQKAVSEGYSATDEDKDTAKKNADTAVKAMTKKQKLLKGLSADDVYNVELTRAVGQRYKKDLIASLGLDYDDITKDIKKADYKQYDFEYYYVSTEGTQDEDGNTVELTKDEIAAKKAIIDKFAETVAAAEDFSTIFGNDEEGNPKSESEDGVQYASGQMIEKDGFEGLDKSIKKLEVGEVSKVLEGENGYYIIKLTDNTSTTSYDNAIQSAKDAAETEAYTKEYETNIEPNFNVTVNYDYWEKVKVGSYSV